MEATATDLFRIIFFIVHYSEVWMLGGMLRGIPYIGEHPSIQYVRCISHTLVISMLAVG